MLESAQPRMDDDQKEVVKAGAEAVVKPFADLIDKLFGGAAEQIGGMWTDRLAARRQIRYIALLKKVRAVIEEAGFEPQQITDSIWVPILQEASLEDDETLQSKWANLLANAADPDRRNAVLPSFSAMLRELTSREAKFLAALYERAIKKERRYSGGRYSPVPFSRDELEDVYVKAGLAQSPRMSNLTVAELIQGGETLRADQIALSTTIDLLLRTGILAESPSANPVSLSGLVDEVRGGRAVHELEVTMATRYQLTHLGGQFVRACEAPRDGRSDSTPQTSV